MIQALGLQRPKDGYIQLLLCLVLAAAAAGCATRQPPRAAMVPQATTGDYGYADKQIGPDSFQVVFTSPRLRAEHDRENSYGLEPERQRVYELALWRAAQLAREKGYPAFSVEQDNRDIDVTVQSQPAYPIGPYPFLFGGPWHWRGGYWPYDYWPGYAYSPSYTQTVTGRVKAVLTIKMLRTKSADAFDTTSTLNRLSRQYGSAQFPGAIYSN